MPVKEIVTKTFAFAVVSAALIVGGVFVFVGSHAYNDYTNAITGGILILVGLITAGVGALFILGILRDAQVRRREARLHITPRSGPPALPPAWGMGDVGRPGSGVIQVGDGTRGGGVVRAVSFRVTGVDAVGSILYLLVWTAVGLIEPAFLWILVALTVVVGGTAFLIHNLRSPR